MPVGEGSRSPLPKGHGPQIKKVVKPKQAPPPKVVVRKTVGSTPKSVIQQNAAQAHRAYHSPQAKLAQKAQAAQVTAQTIGGNAKALRAYNAAQRIKAPKTPTAKVSVAKPVPFGSPTFKPTNPAMVFNQRDIIQPSALQSVIKAVTGVDPRSSHPGSLSNAAINSALFLVPGAAEARGAAEGISAARDAFRAGRGLEDSLHAGAAAAKDARAGATVAKASEAEQKAYYASKLARPEEVAAKSRATKIAEAAKAAPKKVVKSVAATPKQAARKATSVPFGPESRTARAIGAAPAHTLGAAAFPVKANYIAKAGYNQAAGFVNNPTKTLHQTVRVAEQFPAAAITPISAAVSSVRSGSLGPLEKFGQQTIDYAKLYADLAGPSGQAITQNQLGLIPAVTGIVGARALEKPVHDRLVRQVQSKFRDPVLSRKIKAKLDIARDPQRSAAERDQAFADAQKLVEGGKAERPLSRHMGRKRTSVTKATGRSTQESGTRRYGLHNAPRKKDIAKPLAKATRATLPGGLTQADLFPLLDSHGLLGHDNAFILTKLRQERDRLGPAPAGIAEHTVHARRVIDTILADPEKAMPLLDQLREAHAKTQTAVHLTRGKEVSGTSAITAADEAVQFQHIARMENITPSHSTVHPELRGLRTPNGKALADSNGNLLRLDNGKPAKVMNVDTALKGRASTFKGKVRKLEAQAFEAGKKTPRGRDLQAQADRLTALATTITDVVNRRSDANKLRVIANRVDAGQTLTRDDAQIAGNATAADLRAQADHLDTLDQASKQARHDEFMGHINKVMAEKPYSVPQYHHQVPVAQSRAAPAIRTHQRARLVAKEKFNQGFLAQSGTADLSGSQFWRNLNEQQKGLAERPMLRRFIQQEVVKVDGHRFLTPQEKITAFEQGKLPSDGAPLSPGDFAAAIQRDPALRAEYQAAQLRARAQVPLGTPAGRIEMWGRSKAAIDELKAQDTPSTGIPYKVARTLGRAESMAIIATSPVWFTLQLGASALWLAYSQPNPVVWVNAINHARELRKADPGTVSNMEGLMGSTRGGTGAHSLSLNAYLHGDPVVSTSRVMRFARDNPVARFGHLVAQNLKEGGPAIIANQLLEAKVRGIAGMMAQDQLLKDVAHQRVKQFVGDTSALTDEMAKQADALRKVPEAQRADWLVSHPQFHQHYQTLMERALGSWNHLSSAERNMQAAVIFYPFLRASSRWFLWTAPLHTPLRYAVIANLAQSNNVLMDKLQKSTGSAAYLTQYGEVPLYGTGPGFIDPTTGKPSGISGAVNLYRIAPGGNTLLEAIGGGGSLFSQGASVVQPAVGNTMAALAGQDPYGNPSKGTVGQQLVQNLISLNPLSRAAWLQHSSASQLFTAVAGKPTGASTLIPDPYMGLDRIHGVQNVSVLSALFNKATAYSKAQLGSDTAAAGIYKNSNPAKGARLIAAANKKAKASADAWTKIDRWYKQYKIPKDGPTNADVKWAFSILAQDQYQPSSSTSLGGGLSGGGLGGGGL